jgi:oligopeptide transport system substrate-binding protein
MFKPLASEAVTRLDRVTSDGLTPGRLDGVTDKPCLPCSPSARGRGEIGRRCRLKIGFPWSAGSSPAVRTTLIALALAGCDRAAQTGPIRVVAIGPRPALADPARTSLAQPSRLLVDAVAQGLVRFDANGQIEPGLAERWIVTDEGRSYIFRLRPARWTDGTPVTTAQVATRLRRLMTRSSLRPFLTAVEEVVAMTPEVVEVRLRRPRPDLLKLFAQPELALLRPGRTVGTGPMLATADGQASLLRPRPEPDVPEPEPREQVRLSGERASLALARFAAGDADLVTGGTFANWPLVATAAPPRAAVRVDPAMGLFGLSVVRRDGFLADPARRAAVAQAFDRPAIVATAPGWAAEERLLPDRLDSAAPPQAPTWAAPPLAVRRAEARAIVASWGKPVALRIALPQGPGATLLWGRLAAGLLAIGITPERVGPTAPADLRLLDAVAPYDSARWYLAQACQPCGGAALPAILAARDAPTMAERAQRLAEADAALTADVAFIPLARPFRWSVVAPRVTGWQPNARAWHPLNRLVATPN